MNKTSRQKKEIKNPLSEAGTIYFDEACNRYINNGITWQPLRDRNIDHAIQTISGKFFWPLEAYADEVCLEDIAHGLAKECRFGNHTPFHYSVAWHSVVLSNVVPDHLKKWALIHDTTEAYLRDLPRPIKRHPALKEYIVMEDKLMVVLAGFFGMSETVIPEELKEYDTDMCNCELLVLFGDIGKAKLRARGYEEDYVNKVLEWKSWIIEYSAEDAKLIWLAQYEELFG